MKRHYLLAFAAALLAGVTACGGGSGGATSNTAPVVVIPPVVEPPPPLVEPPPLVAPPLAMPAYLRLFNTCQSPNPALAPFFERQGTLADEQTWLRSWVDDAYLWYDEIPASNPADFNTVTDYFAVLKTPAITASGKPKDRFHFTYPSEKWEALQTSGVAVGYGLLWSRSTGAALPRTWLVSQVEPGSPADTAGVRRGDQLLMVDGSDFVNGSGGMLVDRLNAGLFPAHAGEIHRLVLSRKGDTWTATLGAASVAANPVQNTKVVETGSGRVGYLTFNSHNAVSERLLIDAIGQLKAGGVSDLVLDVRYNGGGLLDLASELAYMIAGPAATSGKTFERLEYNRKQEQRAPIPFHDRALGFRTAQPAARDQPLPYLALKRVTLLTTAGSCSATESIINSLRGVDVEVNLIGGATCGKPYGFTPVANCGTTYFAVMFKGVNDKGFGDYADGIAPTCAVPDDLGHEIGDPAEGMLAAALGYRATKACPVQPRARSVPLQLVRSPAEEISIYQPR